jgi:hypothetical protein
MVNFIEPKEYHIHTKYCKFDHSEMIFGPFEKLTFFGEHPLTKLPTQACVLYIHAPHLSVAVYLPNPSIPFNADLLLIMKGHY